MNRELNEKLEAVKGLLGEAKVEIKLPHEDPVAVGKIVFSSGKVQYYITSKSGLKTTYPNPVKFRYQLRNAANVPNANKLVDKLDADLPTPKNGKKQESAYDLLRESLGLDEAAPGREMRGGNVPPGSGCDEPGRRLGQKGKVKRKFRFRKG